LAFLNWQTKRSNTWLWFGFYVVSLHPIPRSIIPSHRYWYTYKGTSWFRGLPSTFTQICNSTKGTFTWRCFPI